MQLWILIRPFADVTDLIEFLWSASHRSIWCRFFILADEHAISLKAFENPTPNGRALTHSNPAPIGFRVKEKCSTSFPIWDGNWMQLVIHTMALVEIKRVRYQRARDWVTHTQISAKENWKDETHFDSMVRHHQRRNTIDSSQVNEISWEIDHQTGPLANWCVRSGRIAKHIWRLTFSVRSFCHKTENASWYLP